jgi:hypothetical protein
MLHARSDYDCIQPWPQKRPHYGQVDGIKGPIAGDNFDNVGPIIPEDEPVALIRGQDPVGWRTVLAYCDIAEDMGGVDPDLVQALRLHADKMKDWCERVGKDKPDAPAGALRL